MQAAEGGASSMALVLCPSDIAHTRRRAALQPGIDAVWRLCGGSAGPPGRLSEKMWAAFWKRVLKVVAPPHEYDGEAARGWCAEDWGNALRRFGGDSPGPELSHNGFSEAVTVLASEWWGLEEETCASLHEAWLKVILRAIATAKGGSFKDLNAVESRGKFLLGLRDSAKVLAARPRVRGQRSPLARINAELADGTFSLAEAFQLEDTADFGPEPDDDEPPVPEALDLPRVSHLAAAAAADPSTWLARIDGWSAEAPAEEASRPPSVAAAGNAVADEEPGWEDLNSTAGSVVWVDALGDDPSQQPVNPVLPPARLRTPAELRANQAPLAQPEQRPQPPSEEKQRSDFAASPPAVVRVASPKPPALPLPSPIKRSHKEIAKALYARHNAKDKEPGPQLPKVTPHLSRRGHAQVWSPRDEIPPRPAQIQVGRPKGKMRPFQAPPDPESKDATGKQKNRHQRPKGGNVAARRERQKAEERQVMEVPAVGTPGDGAPRPALVPSPPPTQRAQTERLARSPRARGTHPDKAVAVSLTLLVSAEEMCFDVVPSRALEHRCCRAVCRRSGSSCTTRA